MQASVSPEGLYFKVIRNKIENLRSLASDVY